ncbi:MAG: hypothetical protein H0W76_22400, partial [Pyrinomonadaceae bacterium]|nr:hypothetical protein [Pyrinomonadaceae bacterium]
WIGVYPSPFIKYIQQPVDAVVRQVRPDYPMPGQSPRRVETAGNKQNTEHRTQKSE